LAVSQTFFEIFNGIKLEGDFEKAYSLLLARASWSNCGEENGRTTRRSKSNRMYRRLRYYWSIARNRSSKDRSNASGCQEIPFSE